MQNLQLLDKTERIEKERKASINETSQEAIGAGIPEESEFRYLCP